MAKLKDKVTRKNLPTGQDGEALVLDSNSPDGLRWAPGIDRLITDIAPELAGDLDASDYSITGINNLEFTDAAGTVADIQNGNLLDKTADETIGGAWTYDDVIAMDDNKITGLGDPTADQDAATKAYVDGQNAGYLSATHDWVDHSNVEDGGTATLTRPGPSWFAAMTGWELHANSGWSESSGEFSYGGSYPTSDPRVFLVQWSIMEWILTTADYTSVMGIIRKKPSGGVYADVDGSQELSAFDSYLAWFGSFYSSQAVSGRCIVSMRPGDVIKFQNGMYSYNAAGTYTADSYAPKDQGATLTITPIK